MKANGLLKDLMDLMANGIIEWYLSCLFLLKKEEKINKFVSLILIKGKNST